LIVFLLYKEREFMPRRGIYVRKGRPTGPGYEAAGGFKDVKLEALESDLEKAEIYSDPESGESLVHERHPNRNLDKPHIDKPRYS
jgi:hypothetical protein